MGENLRFGSSCSRSFHPKPVLLPLHSRARWSSAGSAFPPSPAQFTLFTWYFSGKRNRNKSPDHLVAVAMRGSLRTAHAGAAPRGVGRDSLELGCCSPGLPLLWVPSPWTGFWGYFRRVWAIQGKPVATRLQRFLLPDLVAVELGCAAKELPGAPALLRDGGPSPRRVGSPALTVPALHGSSEWPVQRKLREFFAIPRCLVSVFSLFLVELIRFLGEAVVQALVVGVLTAIGDHVLKPFLAAAFHSLLQPLLLFLLKVLGGVRDLTEPVLDVVARVCSQLAVLLRAVRLVEIRLRPDLRAGPADGGA